MSFINQTIYTMFPPNDKGISIKDYKNNLKSELMAKGDQIMRTMRNVQDKIKI